MMITTCSTATGTSGALYGRTQGRRGAVDSGASPFATRRVLATVAMPRAETTRWWISRARGSARRDPHVSESQFPSSRSRSPSRFHSDDIRRRRATAGRNDAVFKPCQGLRGSAKDRRKVEGPRALAWRISSLHRNGEVMRSAVLSLARAPPNWRLAIGLPA